MILHGHFQNGVVVLDGGTPLPDGTAVTVAERDSFEKLLHHHPNPTTGNPFPLIVGDKPGSLDLTPDQINEFAYGHTPST